MKMTKEQFDAIMGTLRIQLFAAAQRLEGDQLVEFWQLISDINAIRPPEHPERPS